METHATEFRSLLLAQRCWKARVLRLAIPCGAIGVCLGYSSADARARASIIGACFTCIESLTYYSSGRGVFSTVDQFGANVVYGSLVLDRWQRADLRPYARVALGPATIWILEIVQNYLLLLAFGRNTAWCYTGCRHAYFHGAIDLAMVRHGPSSEPRSLHQTLVP